MGNLRQILLHLIIGRLGLRFGYDHGHLGIGVVPFPGRAAFFRAHHPREGLGEGQEAFQRFPFPRFSPEGHRHPRRSAELPVHDVQAALGQGVLVQIVGQAVVDPGFRDVRRGPNGRQQHQDQQRITKAHDPSGQFFLPHTRLLLQIPDHYMSLYVIGLVSARRAL